MRSLWIMLLASLACGDTDPDPLDEDTTVPLEWSVGDRVAAFTALRLTRDSFLGEPQCGMVVQFAEAVIAGSSPRLEPREGACILTDQPHDLRAGDWVPVFGGTVDLRVGAITEVVTVGNEAIADPIGFDCARLESMRTVSVTSVAGEDAGDSLGDLNAEIALQAAPIFSAPVEMRPGVANWPDGELTLRWNGDLGDSVEVVLSNRDATGPVVRCHTTDDGEFTLPPSLADRFRDAPANVEVARVGLVRQDVDGVDVRLASRSATQIWLQVPDP